MKYTFVILHYLTIEDTKSCVESIRKQCASNKYNIIVVDNGSSNNTGVELRKIYEKDNDIEIILSKTNLGFANGNNLGFKKAIKKYKPDFIIMINNDTLIIDNKFLQKISKEYSDSHFGVLGPKIILADNTVNPINLSKPDEKIVKKEIKIIKRNIFLAKYNLYNIYYQIKNILKRILKRESDVKSNDLIKAVEERHENIILHGCALIFSKEYFKLFNGLDDRTFLYREEELLYLRCQNNNIKMVYNPDIVIYHKEDSSTNALTITNKKKILFKNKHLLKSSKVLLDELQKSKV